MDLLALLISATSSLHLVGEHMRWKVLERRNAELRSLASNRFLGVVYLKARLVVLPVAMYPFHPRVVSLLGSCRHRTVVSHDSMTVVRSAGKSLP